MKPRSLLLSMALLVSTIAAATEAWRPGWLDQYVGYGWIVIMMMILAIVSWSEMKKQSHA